MQHLTFKSAFLVSAFFFCSCNSSNTDQTGSTADLLKDTVVSVTKANPKDKKPSSEPKTTFEKDSIDFSVDTFTTLPGEIDGCGCYFYLSKQDEKKEKYLFVNDFASIAFISINGKVEEFKLTEHAENSKIYLYSNGTYHLKVEITKEKDDGYESSVIEGVITVSKGNNVIRKSFVGSCGC